MNSSLQRQSLRVTICLLLVCLLTSFPSRGQNVQDKPAPQDPHASQTSSINSDSIAESAPRTSGQSSDEVAAPNYVLGPEDVVNIEVLNVPELSKSARIANDGTISLPLIGRMQAAGLTTEGLRKELAEKWGENYLQDPQVTVFVTEFKAKPVSVIGAVERPGLFALTGHRTLIEMLSMAGGFGKKGTSSAGRTVLVTRRDGFGDLKVVDGMHMRGPDQIEIDLNRLLYTRDEALDIEIKPLDIISVSKAEVVYVTGAVKKPGGFVLEDRPTMTVLQAIAVAEGFTSTAARRSASIVRTNQDGTKVVTYVNLTKIMRGKAEDVTLAANDTLVVPDSKGKIVGQRAADSAIAAFTGWLIWAH